MAIAHFALAKRRSCLSTRWAVVVFGIAIFALAAGAAAQEAKPKTKLFVVHFSTGANWDHGKSPQKQDGFSEHSANLRQPRSAAGHRFGARYAAYGMIIIDGSSVEAVNQLIASDPGVQSGIFTFTVAPISVFYEWRDPETSGRGDS